MKQVKKAFNWSDFKKVRVSKKYLLTALAVFVLAGTSFAYQAAQNSESLRQTKITNNEDEINRTSGGNNASNQPPTNSTRNSNSSSVGTTCYTANIPYGTTRQSASWLYVGQTEVANRGITGKKTVCSSANGTKNETVISKAFDEVINVGSKSRETATTPTAPQYTHEQAMSDAQYACRAIYYDSTQHGDCVASELHKRGF